VKLAKITKAKNQRKPCRKKMRLMAMAAAKREKAGEGVKNRKRHGRNKWAKINGEERKRKWRRSERK